MSLAFSAGDAAYWGPRSSSSYSASGPIFARGSADVRQVSSSCPGPSATPWRSWSRPAARSTASTTNSTSSTPSPTTPSPWLTAPTPPSAPCRPRSRSRSRRCPFTAGVAHGFAAFRRKRSFSDAMDTAKDAARRREGTLPRTSGPADADDERAARADAATTAAPRPPVAAAGFDEAGSFAHPPDDLHPASSATEIVEVDADGVLLRARGWPVTVCRSRSGTGSESPRGTFFDVAAPLEPVLAGHSRVARTCRRPPPRPHDARAPRRAPHRSGQLASAQPAAFLRRVAGDARRGAEPAHVGRARRDPRQSRRAGWTSRRGATGGDRPSGRELRLACGPETLVAARMGRARVSSDRWPAVAPAGIPTRSRPPGRGEGVSTAPAAFAGAVSEADVLRPGCRHQVLADLGIRAGELVAYRLRAKGFGYGTIVRCVRPPSSADSRVLRVEGSPAVPVVPLIPPPEDPSTLFISAAAAARCSRVRSSRQRRFTAVRSACARVAGHGPRRGRPHRASRVDVRDARGFSFGDYFKDGAVDTPGVRDEEARLRARSALSGLRR